MRDFKTHFSLLSILRISDKNTFHHNNGSESQIDTILYRVPGKTKEPFLKDHLCNQEHSENLSAYDVISGTFLEGHPICKICESGESESLSHVKVICDALSEPRQKILQEIIQFCKSHTMIIDPYLKKPEDLTQFLLDPSSMNLPFHRVNINDPILAGLFQLSRDLSCALHNLKIKKVRLSIGRNLKFGFGFGLGLFWV